MANWPERRIAHWQTLLEARAIENQCYVAGVNRIGTDNHQLSYNGKSKLIDPWGDELIELNGEQCASVVINYTKLIEIREKIPFLKDR